MIAREDLFTSGSHGYHIFRIPALVATPTGTLLLFSNSASIHARE